jgi:hypothetical protein
VHVAAAAAAAGTVWWRCAPPTGRAAA